MIAILNTLIFLLFFLFLTGINLRMLRQVGKIPLAEASIVFILVLVGFNMLPLWFAIEHYELLQFESEVPFSNIAYGLLAFSSVVLAVIVKMKPVTKKKLRTLLRLPIIGALAGFYFKDERVLYILIGVELVLSVYFLINKDEYNYIFRQQVKAFIGILIFYVLVKSNLIGLSLLGLFLYILMKYQIINQIKLKLVLENSQNDL